MTVATLIYLSLRDIEVVYPGQLPSTDEITDGFNTVQEILGSWSHEGLLVPTHAVTVFALAAGTLGYTMGVGAVWATAALPIKIKGAIASVSGFQKGLTVLPMGEYQKLVANGIGETAALPALLGYDDAAPVRNVRLYPTPSNSAASIEVSYWTPITQFVTSGDTIAFALPAFEQALRNELTLRLAVMFNRPVTQAMAMNATASKMALTRTDPGEVPDQVAAPPAPQAA